MALSNEDLDRRSNSSLKEEDARWVEVVDESSPYYGRRGLVTLQWSSGRTAVYLVALGDPLEPQEFDDRQLKEIRPGDYIVGEVMER